MIIQFFTGALINTVFFSWDYWDGIGNAFQKTLDFWL